MFYIKQSFGYCDVITEIHDDNVYCHCPVCGIEQQVDLAEVFKSDEIDLYGTTILCTKCTKEQMEKGGGV